MRLPGIIGLFSQRPANSVGRRLYFLCAGSVISHNPSARRRQAGQPVIVKPDETTCRPLAPQRAAKEWQLSGL
jgi:hypothetical protein